MLLIALAGAVLALAGPARLVSHYFLTPCAGAGPEQNADFEIRAPALDLAAYYAELEAFRGSFRFEELDAVAHEGQRLPIHWIRRERPGGPRLLVVAGVHGDERAALIGLPRFLEGLRATQGNADRWDVSVVAPVNPVGVAERSRYNTAGCDINRDFAAFATREARAVRRVVEATAPDLVVATHEGPQAGFFLIATAAADAARAEAVVREVGRGGVALAERSFLGLGLGTPGLSVEGRLMASAKRWIGLGSLGTYLESRHVASYTTESSWGSDAFDERARSHVLALQAILSTVPARPRDAR